MKKSVKNLKFKKVKISTLSQMAVVGGSYNCPPVTLGCGGGSNNCGTNYCNTVEGPTCLNSNDPGCPPNG
ncbi:hypothetical protein ACJD0Z_02630 [Flavobacteriaceae bacterium M23B6Z8]